MTTHTKILKELQTFRGGEFVPQHSDNLPCNRLEHDDRLGWIYCDTGGTWSPTCDRDAHAHIELAAWKAVRWFCAANTSDLVIMDNFPDDPERHDLIKKQWDGGVTKLGTGPDDATALLAAMKYINGGGA